MKIKNTLYVLIGIPGCGKDTWIAKTFEALRGPYIVTPDDIRKEMGDIDNQEDNHAVFNIAKGRITAALECGHDVVINATNINTGFRRQMLHEFKDYNIEAILFDVDPAIAYERISKDIFRYRCRADVPEYVVYRMYGEFLYVKKVIKDEGFNAIHNAEDFRYNAE